MPPKKKAESPDQLPTRVSSRKKSKVDYTEPSDTVNAANAEHPSAAAAASAGADDVLAATEDGTAENAAAAINNAAFYYNDIKDVVKTMETRQETTNNC